MKKGHTKISSFGISKYIKTTANIRIFAMLSTFMLVVFAGLMVFPIVLKGNSAEAAVVPSTTELTIESGKNTAGVNLSPASIMGTFAMSNSANEAAFDVTTNNLGGYSLSLVSGEDDPTGRLVNSNDDNAYLEALSADVDEDTFRTGAATTYNNKWGYKLTVNDTVSTDFLAAPVDSTKTIYATNAPNITVDSYTLGLGVRADYLNPVGAYTNTFILAVVSNPVSYQINYLDNTSDSSVSGLPASDGTTDVTASAIILVDAEPVRKDYIFSGWCDGIVIHKLGEDSTCTGAVYQAGGDFTFSSIYSAGTATINLYAMWDKAVYIQDFTSAMCIEQATDKPIKVMDRRDGEVYHVQKLADDNCWLLDNLRLDPTQVSLDSLIGNTNATEQALTHFKNGGGGSPYPSSGVVAKTATGGSWSSTYTLPYIVTQYTNTVQGASGSAPAGKIGVYYNYCAASAGSYCYATSAEYNGDASNDVCPAGWRMPTGGESGEYQALRNYYDSDASFMEALNTPLSGYFYSGSAKYQGSSGEFWSSTNYNKSAMFRMVVDDSFAYPQQYDLRNTGNSVRCIRNVSSTTITFNGNGATGGSMNDQLLSGVNTSGFPTGAINYNTFTRDGYYFTGWNTEPDGSGVGYDNGATYTASATGNTTITLYAQWFGGPAIQDFTTDMCSAQAASQDVNVIDVRDGNMYTVRYINGNCWMTQNIRYLGDTGSLNGSIIMEADTSNVDVGKKLSYTDLTDSKYTDYSNKLHVATEDQTPSGNTPKDIGVWYNYAAATAGTIADSNSYVSSQYDVCPKGWRLPKESELSTITSYVSDFSPVVGGYYSSTNLYGPDNAYWWSSTVQGTTIRRILQYYSNTDALKVGSDSPTRGFFVRCIRNISSTTITFNGNGATDGSMDNQLLSGVNVYSGLPTGKLNRNTFTRDGYYFAGWNTEPDGSGVSYDNGADYTASTTGNTAVTLYAQWFDGSVAIQDFTASMCSAQASSKSAYVRDARDDNIYTVRYINDRCWMTQNLRYVGDSGSVSGSMIMKAATSNIDTDTTLVYTDLTSGNNANEPRIHVATNDQVPFGVAYTAEDMGVWYNYAAASAGYVTSDQNSQKEAIYSVCPKGWRLPNNSLSEGDMLIGGPNYLLTAPLGSDIANMNNYRSVFASLAGGNYSYGRINNSKYGYWWSSTTSSDTHRYDLDYDGSRLGYGTGDRYIGNYIRCVRTNYATIAFDGNGATGGSMLEQIISAPSNSDIPSGTLTANAFTNDDKTFAGWNTKPDGSGASYSDKATYTASTVGDVVVTLYAQWLNN